MSDRDKKILMVIAPVVILVAFWLLLLSPKRAEVSKLGDDVSAAEQQRDTAVSSANALEGSRKDYAKDYETVVRLGKAVPSSLDMPSLLVQLDSAAKGTGINFDSVKAGERAAATAAAAPAAAPSSGSGEPPVAAGGEKAQTGAGQSAEKANNASAQSDQANQAATQQPPATGSSDSSSSSAGAAAPAGEAAQSGTSGVSGLDSVPLDFTFTGSYFDLADFFHRMKRFVRVANEDIKVRGRLMTIDNLDFTATSFPTISANVKATVYLTPKTEGTTAGATPNGPSTAATPAGSSTPPATGSAATPATPAPTPASAPAAGGE